MLVSQKDLTKLIEDLKSNRIDLKKHINEICDLMENNDFVAFVPERNRRLRLLKEAEELEQLYPDSLNRPPLYGVLVGIKDIFRVDGFPTKAGSQLPEHLFHGPEAKSVKLLRKAGALILGKTATTEFAFLEPGPTLNPHHVEHTPGGSSSGSAAAVAAGFCPIALGTQTIGSVIRPAAYCGVVGFKPSFGRIETEGLINFSKSMDHAGFFTRHVNDINLVAAVLCKGWNEIDQLQELSKPAFGVPEGPYLDQMPLESLTLFESHLKKLADAGYEIIRVPVFENIQAINQLHHKLITSELAEEHSEWFSDYETLYRPMTKQAILDGQKVNDQEAEKARELASNIRKQLKELMEKNHINLWICPPAQGPAPKGLHSTGNPIMNLPWTFTGMPAITIPVEKINGLPVGVQLIGQFMEDEQLVGWANQISKVYS